MARISFQQIPEKMMSCMMHTENHINSLNILPLKQLELMRFYVSQINECAYCVDMHFKEAIAAGENEQRLYSVSMWRETDYYSANEKAMLQWAETVTRLNESEAQRQTAFNTLAEYFSTEEIANLTLAIMQINSWTRLAKSAGFEAGNYQAA